MKIGIHSMVWVGDWSEAAAHEAISKSAETGYDLIELSAIAPETFDVDLTSKLLAEYSLDCSASLGLGAATDISSEDPDAVKAGRERLHLALNLVRDCGGSMLCGVIYGALMKYSHPATERGLENSRSVLAELADKAAESNIRLGLEFCNRYETNVINTTAQTLAFIDSIGRDNVTAHLDTYHMNIEEKGLANGILRAREHLKYIHLSASDRGTPGMDTIQWDEVFGALAAIEFKGGMAMESFITVPPQIASALSVWRDVAPSREEVLTDGLDFLKMKARQYGLI